VEKQSVRQMQGAVGLARDATAAVTSAIGDVHTQTANVPYAILKQIPLVRGPVVRIERVQSCITVVVYQSIHTISTLSAFVVTQALGAFEHKSTGK
jgi:hypothetical protein